MSSNVRIVGSGSRDHLSIFESKNPSFCVSCPGTRPQRPAENKIMRNFSRIDLHFRNPNGRLQHGTGNIRSRRSVVEMALPPSSKGDRLIRGDAPERFRLKIGKNTGWSCNGKKVPFSAVLTAGSAKKCRFYHVSGFL